jgi:hypothetical protein
LATAVFEAVAKQLEMDVEYGPVILTGKDGWTLRCANLGMAVMLGSQNLPGVEPASETLRMTTPLSVYELVIAPESPEQKARQARLGTVLAWREVGLISDHTPKQPEPLKPEKRKLRPRMLTAEAAQLPDLPKIEGDGEVFVHTVRAGSTERRDLALILADSAERCRSLPRFAKVFGEWSHQLLAAYDDGVADVVLFGKASVGVIGTTGRNCSGC